VVQTRPIPIWTNELATVTGLVTQGLNRQTIRRRVGRGTWLEPLPGVISRVNGTLTADQQLVAALLYGGQSAALSHATAGSFWGLASRPSRVHITVTHGRHIGSTALVAIHQTTRSFAVRCIDGMLLTPPPRTVIDMCLDLGDLDAVRNVMGRAVQRERVTINEIAEELARVPRRGSMLPRHAFEEIAHNAHAASEARLVRLLLDAGTIPLPEFNASLATGQGVKVIDALWRDLGKGVEIDGRAYHLDPRSWAADLARQNAVHLAGVVLLRIAARRLWSDPKGVIDEIRAFLAL